MYGKSEFTSNIQHVPVIIHIFDGSCSKDITLLMTHIFDGRYLKTEASL